MTKADRLSAALDEFLTASVDIEAAAIVSIDGLPIASALPVDVAEDRLAAMSAALLSLGEKAAEGLGRGELAQVFVEGENGYVVLMAAGPQAVLVSVTSRQAKAGLVLFEMRRACERIKKVLADTDRPAETTQPSAEAPSAQAPIGQTPDMEALVPPVPSWQ
ncbi:MAG TPA: roadblock/LC7 domain-containing protein [Actinomycetota bacterium]|nr:roadblock/LC7 domain-containing protein [Actinomycetota bacterium]